MLQYKMKIHGQYIKDLSFENPNSPFLSTKESPIINVMVNIYSARLDRTKIEKSNNIKKIFNEITLHIEVKAILSNSKSMKNNIAFICETQYCGVFSIENLAELSTEEIKKTLFVAGPTFLFPFAREIIASTTSSGGFPPLMLDPIDFGAMYESRINSKIP